MRLPHQLSDHFFLHELTRSQIASRRALPNQPDQQQIEALQLLCLKVLEPVRRHVKVPIIPSSGFRNIALNRLLGSRDSSSHCRGEAVDFEVMGVPNIQLAHWISDNLDFDQLILEYPQADNADNGWLHLSYKAQGNRAQRLTRDHDGYHFGLPRVPERF